MMKISLGVIILVLICCSTANAKIHSIISIENCSRLASHIVVVTEGDEIDGQVTILESWRGDLESGDSLNITRLAKFNSEYSRRIQCMDGFLFLRDCKDDTPESISGSRIILFLRNIPDKSGSEKWSPLGGIWIEKGRAYGLCDGEDVFGGTFIDVGSQESVRECIRRTAQEKEGLKSALEIEDIEARLRALEPSVNSPARYTRIVASVEIDALKRIASSPPISIPTVKCSDECAEALITFLIRRELEFWRAYAPKLMMGCYNDQNIG